MAGAPTLDSPWGGTKYNPPSRLDIAAIEESIVARLKTACGDLIRSEHFPDAPKEWRYYANSALVIFAGSEYGEQLSTDIVQQDREMDFNVAVVMRDLGWTMGSRDSAGLPGAYQVIEAIRRALTGFRPNRGCKKMYPKRERFVVRDQDVWVYEILFAVAAYAVEDYEQPNFPLLTKIQAFEEGGQTTTSVPAAEMTFAGNPNQIALGFQNISNVIVTSLDGATTYSLGTDYSVDTVNGFVNRIATGAIAPNATVNVQFAYAEVVTAIAGGGTAPEYPTN